MVVDLAEEEEVAAMVAAMVVVVIAVAAMVAAMAVVVIAVAAMVAAMVVVVIAAVVIAVVILNLIAHILINPQAQQVGKIEVMEILLKTLNMKQVEAGERGECPVRAMLQTRLIKNPFLEVL